MARNNTMSATFSQASGDGASGYTESSGSKSFTSGDSVKIEGTISHSGAVVYDVDNYGMAQADGIYFENRDSTNFITLILKDASASALATLKIAPEGVFMVRVDVDQTAHGDVNVTVQSHARLSLSRDSQGSQSCNSDQILFSEHSGSPLIQGFISTRLVRSHAMLWRKPKLMN